MHFLAGRKIKNERAKLFISSRDKTECILSSQNILLVQKMWLFFVFTGLCVFRKVCFLCAWYSWPKADSVDEDLTDKGTGWLIWG